MVGHRRRDLRARPARLGRAARALRLGLGLPRDAAARGCWRCSRRCASSPRTSTRRRSRWTTSAASCRSSSSARSSSRINFAAGAERADRGDRADRPRGRGVRSPSCCASGASPTRSTTCTSRRGPTFWVAAVRGHHRLRLADGARSSSASSSCRTCSATRRSTPAPSIIPAALAMIVVAPRSAKLVDARGSRFTLLVGYVFCLLGFLDDAPALGRGHPVLEGRRSPTCSSGSASASRARPPRTR